MAAPAVSPPAMASPALPDASLQKSFLKEDKAPTPAAPRTPDSFVHVAVDTLSLRHRGNSSFMPPTVLHEASPDVPLKLRHSIQQEVSVRVRVYVDRAGTVQYAELLSDERKTNKDLASIAVFSSRHWQFSPAHLGNAPIPAEVVLRFRFGP